MGEAWTESCPLLIISGQVKRSDLKGNSGLRQKGPQEVDIVAMVKDMTKYAVTVMDGAELRYHLEKAVHLATTGRPGPVWIDIASGHPRRAGGAGDDARFRAAGTCGGRTLARRSGEDDRDDQ